MRATDAAQAITAIFISGILLWPRAAIPSLWLLLAIAGSFLIAHWSRVTGSAASAVVLFVLTATLFVRDTIAIPGASPQLDSRSLWVVILIGLFALNASRARWFAERPASLVTAAATATFFSPPSDTAFYTLQPPVLLQVAVLSSAVVLVAFVPIVRWRLGVRLTYVVCEPFLVCVIASCIAAPFVRDARLILPLAAGHFMAVFGLPAVMTAASVTILLYRRHGHARNVDEE